MKHEITAINSQSIAEELGLVSGDILLQINGKKIIDILDYRFTVHSEELLLEIQKPCGEIWEIEIEKDADEDLGMVFKHPLMSAKRRCHNKCIFCFIDQQPPALRKSLYIKDDDPRLSFLFGNYVTLTNLSPKELRRIASYHISPLRISVHAADIPLRKKMMNCENAANLYESLEIFANAGIKMHFQVVLCKNINDGENLTHTIKTLAAQKGAESLAIVPAGITRYREGVYPLELFSKAEAQTILAQIERLQKHCRQTFGKTFVFASDEWYIMAEKPLPTYKQYEDFPQLDNGVGMLRLFEHEFKSKFKYKLKTLGTSPSNSHFFFEKKKQKTLTGKFEIGIVTGYAAAEFMRNLCADFEANHTTVKITVYPIRNDFFGENITVSGLLTGTDILAQLKGHTTANLLFLPENAFRANSHIMLDGTTLKKLSAALGIPIKTGSANGKKFHNQLTASMLKRQARPILN